MSDRYEGKPFLRLLECYVLWSVKQLHPDHETTLGEVAPKLAAAYGLDGSWQEIVAAQMEFPPDLPNALRGMWERTLASTGDQGEAVDPELWAQQVVDSNFT